MSGKIAFCFPGQGSLEAGMGREIAEAVPEAMAVYEAGSRASGLDLRALCFEAPVEELVETEVQQPALVATSLAVLAALRTRGDRAGLRRRPLGRRVRGDLRGCASMTVAETLGLVRERGLAMAEAAAAASRARWPRSSGSTTRSSSGSAARIEGVWPANYNCPGQIVVSGEDHAVEELLALAEAEGRAATVKLQVSGAFHSPLVARAADRLRPAIERVKFSEPIRAVHVHRDRADRAGAAHGRRCSSSSSPRRCKFTQAATELVQGGVTTFVEVGPGNVLSGLVKRIDRSVEAVSGQRSRRR